MIRFIFISFLSLFASTICSGNLERETLLYSSEQLIEDADYYFTIIRQVHPNPYAHCTLSDYENKKNDIYKCLTRYMTKNEFMWLIGTMNLCMDYHSCINLTQYNYFLREWTHYLQEGKIKAFPAVRIQDSKIYAKVGNKLRKIEKINRIQSDSIISFLNSHYNNKLSQERNTFNMEGLFAPWIDIYFNIRSPYIVKYEDSEDEEIVEGVNMREYTTFCGWSIIEPPGKMFLYTIYPYSSIAMFAVNRFEKQDSIALAKTLSAFQDSISKYDIKYIFLNLNVNGGGNYRAFELLDIIPHDTIFEERSITVKINGYNSKQDIRTIARLPNSTTNKSNRQLFVIQGINTGSNADYFCRIIKKNKLGILVGGNTGEPTTTFSYCYFYEMPNTKIKFSVASTLIDYSAYFQDKTLVPDMYWDTNYKRIYFEEKELTDIINKWEKNK